MSQTKNKQAKRQKKKVTHTSTEANIFEVNNKSKPEQCGRCRFLIFIFCFKPAKYQYSLRLQYVKVFCSKWNNIESTETVRIKGILV